MGGRTPCTDRRRSFGQLIGHGLVAHAFVLASNSQCGLVECRQQVVEWGVAPIDRARAPGRHQSLSGLDRPVVVGVGHRPAHVGVSRKMRNSRSVMSV